MRNEKTISSASGGDKDPKENPPSDSRRTFLTRIWVALGVIALAEIIGMVISFLSPRAGRGKTGDSGAVVEAGPVDKFQPESVTAFVRGRFYLARLKDGGFLALSRKCTHLGCSVPWLSDEKRFVCPCHASAFDIRGAVVNPPAPRALDLYPVAIENNIVKVDTAKLLKRDRFIADQVVYPRKA